MSEWLYTCCACEYNAVLGLFCVHKRVQMYMYSGGGGGGGGGGHAGDWMS